MENDELTTEWKEFVAGNNFIKKMELDTTVPLCVDFYEGRHWGKIGEKTKKLPRATFNMVEMIVNSKVSTMLANPIKIVFSSKDMVAQAEKLTRFNSLIEREIRFEELCENIVEQGAVEGSSFVHFYWDSDAIGKRGEYKGGVRAEKIDMLNVVVSDPAEQSVQNQRWIIIASRRDIETVKNMCENERDKKLVIPDGKDEYDTGDMVTVLTKYFRVNNEVYFTQATKNVVLTSPKPLNPELMLNQNIDTNHFRASLYPIEIYQYKPRKNCIYGRGEVETIIPNNRTINFNTAMMSKGVEDQGFGTIVQREGALKVGEKFTNDPSKVLIDRYKGSQNGFYSLTKQPFSAEAYQLNKDIMETTRVVTGVTEVMTGEVMYNNQSGTSIAYLQQQAMKPLEKLIKRYKKFRIRCAEIMFQFYCLYYEDVDMIYSQHFNPNKIENDNITIKETFKSKEYRNIDFDITIELGDTNDYSELNEVSLLDNLLKSDKISLETYYTLYPDHLLVNKQRLLQAVKQEQENAVIVLEKENKQLKAELDDCKNQLMTQKEMYSFLTSTINENKQMLNTIAQLQDQLKNKKENKDDE